MCVCESLPFGFEGGMWNMNVLVPDHCLSFYFGIRTKAKRSELGSDSLCNIPVDSIQFKVAVKPNEGPLMDV